MRWVLGAAAIGAVIACGEVLAVDEPAPPPERKDGAAPDAGTVDFDAGAADAATDADADPGFAQGPACANDLPFGDVEAIADLNELGEIASVRIEPGRALAIVSVDSGAPQYFDVYEGPFPRGKAVYWSLAEDPYGELSPVPLADPLRVLYEQAPIATGPHVLVAASRQQPDQKLGAPAPIALPTGVDAGAKDPWSVDGANVLYFTVEPGELGTRDIHRAELQGGTWTSAPAPGLASALDEAAPVVTPDEKTMYFARKSGGGEDIYVATRSETGAAWSSGLPLPTGTINGDDDDRPTWISPNNCTLLFTSKRGGSWRAYRVDRKHL